MNSYNICTICTFFSKPLINNKQKTNITRYSQSKHLHFTQTRKNIFLWNTETSQKQNFLSVSFFVIQFIFILDNLKSGAYFISILPQSVLYKKKKNVNHIRNLYCFQLLKTTLPTRLQFISHKYITMYVIKLQLTPFYSN